MKAGKSWQFLVVFICFFSWQNSVSAQILRETPEIKTQTKQDGELDLIHLGDLIEVEVLGVFGYNWRGTLTPEGLLNGPDNLTERVFGLCRSESEVAADLTKDYAKFLRDHSLHIISHSILIAIESGKASVVEIGGWLGRHQDAVGRLRSNERHLNGQRTRDRRR